MAADASAYAALGLEPGADATAVERAYKRLIKQYHPDREGGDAGRAAEINRAYRDLRNGRADDDLVFAEDGPDEPARNLPWARAAGIIAFAVILLVLFTGPAGRAFEYLSGAGSSTRQAGGVAPAESTPDFMDQPLHLAAVDAAVTDAVRIARSQDEMALASASRDCLHELRLKPGLAQLDRCAAFDDAVVQLQDRDPLRDQGPFSELAVTGRQMSAGTLLSDDYLAIDSRLDRIRLRVELALAPSAPEPPPPDPTDQR